MLEGSHCMTTNPVFAKCVMSFCNIKAFLIKSKCRFCTGNISVGRMGLLVKKKQKSFGISSYFMEIAKIN